MPRKSIALLCATLAACALAMPFPASAWSGHRLVELSVLDRDHGRWLPEYPHRGDTWIAGTPGHRYSVRLRNTTGERVLVVLSVDGVNAVSGQTADPAQAGYVLGPWQSTEITGWRKSLRDVAQFVFTDLPDSYAARTGRPDDVGVIGIAVFREMHPVYAQPATPPMAEAARDAAKASAPPTAAAAAEADASLAGNEAVQAQRIGTGHGAREWSPVSRTGFQRASHRPDQVSTLRYDEAGRLLALGILPHWRHHDDGRPRAFPGSFVPDPPPRW